VIALRVENVRKLQRLTHVLRLALIARGTTSTLSRRRFVALWCCSDDFEKFFLEDRPEAGQVLHVFVIWSLFRGLFIETSFLFEVPVLFVDQGACSFMHVIEDVGVDANP